MFTDIKIISVYFRRVNFRRTGAPYVQQCIKSHVMRAGLYLNLLLCWTFFWLWTPVCKVGVKMLLLIVGVFVSAVQDVFFLPSEHSDSLKNTKALLLHTVVTRRADTERVPYIKTFGCIWSFDLGLFVFRQRWTETHPEQLRAFQRTTAGWS